jgi:guanylate kinase
MNKVDEFLPLILSSPSGAGKTTLTRLLLERFPDLRFSVSHTTRSPRPTEVAGKDYHFTSRETFLAMVEEDAFIEWAEVHGNLYGTAKSEVDAARKNPEVRGMLFDIDYQGARQIRAKMPDVIGVFILPPSMEELERRLRGRASETEEVVRRRFAVAQREIEHYGFFDYLIVNDDVERAFATLQGVLLAERARRNRQAGQAEQLLRTGGILLPTSPR